MTFFRRREIGSAQGRKAGGPTCLQRLNSWLSHFCDTSMIWLGKWHGVCEDIVARLSSQDSIGRLVEWESAVRKVVSVRGSLADQARDGKWQAGSKAG